MAKVFVLTIPLEGDALVPDGGTEVDGYEFWTLLGKVADKNANGPSEGFVYDSNGNRAGHFEVEDR